MKNYNKLEQHIADSLRNEQLEWDKGAMWKSIEAELPSKDEKRRPFGWIWITPILLAGAIGLAIMIHQLDEQKEQQATSRLAMIELNSQSELKAESEMNPQDPTINSSNIKNTVSPSNSQSSKQKTSTQILTNKADFFTTENQKDPVIKSNPIKPNENFNAQNQNSEFNSFPNNSAFASSSTIEKRIQNTEIQQINESDPNKLNIAENRTLGQIEKPGTTIFQAPEVEKSLVFEQERPQFSPFDPLTVLPLAQLQVKSTKFKKVQPLKRKTSRLALEGSSGGYLLYRNFKNVNDFDYLETKQAAETPLYGLGAGINLYYNLNHKWVVSTGLDYLQINERLDWTQEEGRTQTVILSDSAAYYDAGTERTYLAGEVEQTEILLRSLRHYNTIEQLNIPIRLAYCSQFYKFELLLSAGVQLNFANLVNGRFINDVSGKFSEIKNSEQDYRKIGFNSYSLGLDARYPLSRILKINIGFEHREFINSVFKTNEFPDQRYRLLGIRVGVIYSW